MDQTFFEKLLGVFIDAAKKFGRDHISKHAKGRKVRDLAKMRKDRKRHNQIASASRATQRRLDRQSSKRQRS